MPSVGPGGNVWLNQRNKTKKLLIKNFGMDANLGVMTVRRQSRRKASPITRWSHSARKDIGSNREPLRRLRVRMEARSTPALPTMLLPNQNHVRLIFDMTAFSWKAPEPTWVGAFNSPKAVGIYHVTVPTWLSFFR